MRAIRICDEFHLPQELHRIENCLMKNGYPKHTILKRIEYLQTRPPTASIPNSDEERKWCAIPYIGQVTYQIAGILRTYLNKDLGYYTGIKLSTQLCNYKDKSPSIPSGVYKLSCNCNVVYIGESNNMDRRKKDHNGDLRHRRIDRSALVEHEDNHPSHKIILDSIVLLHYEKRNFQRKFKEAIFIQKNPNNMNRSTGHDIDSWLPLALNLLDE
jgi:predicted GIY-YIG superfamily endonuclease